MEDCLRSAYFLGLRLAEQEIVQGKLTRASGSQQKEDKAIQDGPLSRVHDGPEAAGKVGHKIGNRHLPGKKKGDGAGKEAKADKEGAEKIQYTGKPEQCWEGPGFLAKKTKQFLCPMHPKHEGRNNAKKC